MVVAFLSLMTQHASSSSDMARPSGWATGSGTTVSTAKHSLRVGASTGLVQCCGALREPSSLATLAVSVPYNVGLVSVGAARTICTDANIIPSTDDISRAEIVIVTTSLRACPPSRRARA